MALWIVTRPGKPLFRRERGFIAPVAASAIRSLADYSGIHASLYTIAAWILIAAALVPLTAWWQEITSGRSTLPGFVLYKLMFLAFAALWLLSGVGDEPTPTGRILLPFYPLLVVGIAAGLQEMVRKRNASASGGLMLLGGRLCAVLLAVNFALQYRGHDAGLGIR